MALKLRNAAFSPADSALFDWRFTMKTLVICIVLVLASFQLHAQYKGPQAAVQQQIKAILDNPKDNQGVRLTGYLTEKLSHEKYWFSDGTDQIRVEIEPEDFPAGEFDENDLIEIHGEVEKDFLESPEIDVEYITIKKLN
jgi:uncharacterized protein (TIGR00156 family)